MLDSPLTLLLLGLSAASALASYTATRRRRRLRTQQAPLPALSHLSDEDLLAALATLRDQGDPRATNTPITAQQRASRLAEPARSAIRPASRIREHDHTISVTCSSSSDEPDVQRRVTLLIIEDIERRSLPSSPRT